MGNQLFRPRRLRYEEIWEIAEEFRKEYLADIDEIPVPIEEMILFPSYIKNKFLAYQ